LPKSAALDPRNTKNSVYIHPRSGLSQSQLVLVILARSPIDSGHVTVCVTPTALVRGIQNTENPYAMPMQRCTQSAAGGTSQRLNPGPATVRRLSNSRTE
jgi:hypothetical protein